MKKISIFVLFLLIAGGVVFSQDLGFTAGLDLGIVDFDIAGDSAYLRPMINYMNDSLVKNIELFAELGIPFWFSPGFWAGIDLELKGAYSYALTPVSALDFMVGFQTFIPAVYDGVKSVYPMSPKWRWAKSGEKATSYLIPGVKYSHELNNFLFYGQLNIPVILTGNYLGTDYNFMDELGFNFLFGFDTDFGFSYEVQVFNFLKSRAGRLELLDWFCMIPSYLYGSIYAQFYIGMPGNLIGFEWSGIKIEPMVEYEILDNLSAYMFFSIENIGSNRGKLIYSMGLGARYSF